ncbi:MAG: hypothetical protein AABZ92_03610 [Verrucomicrobiota bacterium]
MTEQQESIVEVPLLDQAAKMLKEQRSFEKELSAQDLTQILSEVIKSLLAGHNAITASVTDMEVEIENQQCVFDGTVLIEKPIQAGITIHCALANADMPQRLKVTKLHIQQEATFFAKVALKAANVKIQEKLKDPNQALYLVLESQLKTKGAKLTAIQLHCNEKSVTVRLEGEAV